MTKNEIKRTALEKLGKLVSSELKYYEDTNQFCQGLEISKDKFTDEENQEISNILESIKNRDGLVFFCDMNDIKSPALSYNNMSLKVKTYTCPNCGAQITNTHNCEYCGSSLVQFAVHGIDVTKTGYMNDDYVFPGLKNSLRKI